MTVPGDIPSVGTEARAEDSVECYFLVASYRDSAKRLRSAMGGVESRVDMSPQLSDFFRIDSVDLGERPRRPSDDSAAVDLIAQMLTSPGGDAQHHYFAVVMVDSSAAMAEAVLRRCRAHPALSALPARWLGLADKDDRKPGGPDDALPQVQVLLARSGEWNPAELSAQLLDYADHLLDRFASGPQETVTTQRLSEMRALADSIAAGLPDSQEKTQQTTVVSNSAPEIGPGRHSAPGPGPDPRPRAQLAIPGYPPPTGDVPEPNPALAGAIPPPRDRPPSFFTRMLRAVGRFFVRIWRFIVRVWRLVGRGSGPEPALAPVDGLVRLVLLVVVGDGRPDPVEDSQGWSFQARVERELARVSAGFWVRPLSFPGVPSQLLHPARPRAWSERPPASFSLDMPGALEAVVEALTRDVATLQGGSWKIGRPAVVCYFSRVPLSDPRTVRAYSDLMTAARPVVTWVVPPGSEDLIAPQLRNGAAIIPGHRGAARDVVRLLCDQLGAR